MDYKVKDLLNQYLYNDILTVLNNSVDFDVFKNKTVLITGAENPVGYYLACAFLADNDINESNTKIIVTDREKSLFEKYGNINSRTDIDFVVSNFYSNIHNKTVDYIIHTDTTVGKDYFESVENLLNYGLQADCKSMVFCTDMSIYGQVYNGKSKLCETDEGYIDLSEAEEYSVQAQRMAETYGRSFASENQLHIKFARLCECIGSPRICTLSENDEFTIATGMQISTDNVIRSFCYVTDMASALLHILVNGEDNEVYNVSSGCDTSSKYIAEVCQQLIPEIQVKDTNKNNNISNDYSVSPLSATRFILDNSKLLKIGFKPKVTLADGIKRMIKITFGV